ncbi:MAG: isoprenylcysteine carboxylmethyltransferase family protein [Eubacteriaceae bacterium]|nr:isoprenylcysteine carboxylmethyltransferase family protein [Eubacteriaceae bacterium]
MKFVIALTAGYSGQRAAFPSGFALAVPILLMRFPLLWLLSKEAYTRAGHYAPAQGAAEAIALAVHQISTTAFFCTIPLQRISLSHLLREYIGLGLYIAGIALLALSTVCYAYPSASGISMSGIYRFSRNPMYLGYFFCFAGCCALTGSIVLLFIAVANAISTHWVILSEERWCIQKFGEEYLGYMQKVRRYF